MSRKGQEIAVGSATKPGEIADSIGSTTRVVYRRKASRNALPSDFTRIIRLIEDGQIKTDPWITHRTTFDELIDVFPSYTRPETGVIKAIIAVN